MIEKIISTSRTTEVHGVATLIINRYKQAELPDNPFLPGIITNLITQTDELRVAIDRTKHQSVLAAKDKVRDDAVRAIAFLLLGYTYYPDQDVRDAAAVVKAVFDKYGLAIIDESYVTESSLIFSMLADFATPQVQTALTLLPGVSKNIAALQAAQDNFRDTRAEFAQQEAEESLLVNATTLQKEVVDIINNDLVMFLRTAERLKGADYEVFAATVGEIIAQNNAQVKKRRKKDDNGK